MSHDPIEPWIREIVWINAAVFVAFGFGFLLFPAQLAAYVDLELRTPSALSDLRAIYGGLPLAVGALFVLGLRRQAWFAPALFLVMATSAGLALARIYSIAVAGVPGPLVLGFLATELLSFGWAFLAYRALEARDAAALGQVSATRSA